MAKVFLDTNIFIDAIHRHPEKEVLDSLLGATVFISPLSVHIYCYLFKIKIPDQKLSDQLGNFVQVSFTQQVTNHAQNGPTRDFEDNVQLHSAVEAECDIFLTSDKKILSMKYFGKLKIKAV